MDTRSDLFQFRYGFVASLFSRLEKRRGLGSAFFFRRSNCATGLLYLLFSLFRAWVGWSSASSDRGRSGDCRVRYGERVCARACVQASMGAGDGCELA